MAFEFRRRWRFAAQLSTRGLIVGCLAAVGLALVLTGRPVLGLIAWVLAILVIVDLIRVAGTAENAMRDLVDQLASGAHDLPAKLNPAFRELDGSIVRALRAMRDRETQLLVQADADRALLDTVAAALFVIGEDATLVRTNRAARGLAPSLPDKFTEHPIFSPEEREALLVSQPDAGRIVRLTDGRAAHVSVALLALADGRRQRLIAVQIVSESLGAVEIDAWHRLSRVLAHEMMNSLSPVISLAESLVSLIQEPTADPNHSQAIAAATTIARRAQHLMSFVERYRQLLSIPQPELARVHLAEFAEELATLARTLDPRVDIRVTVEPANVTASFDRELIEQALINLLKNAIEAVQDSEQPLVVLRCSLDEAEVEISVEDNGAGLPNTTDDLFLPFFTTKPEGAGIGLAIARQIAIAHNGNLVARRQAIGATFALCLPAK